MMYHLTAATGLPVFWRRLSLLGAVFTLLGWCKPPRVTGIDKTHHSVPAMEMVVAKAQVAAVMASLAAFGFLILSVYQILTSFGTFGLVLGFFLTALIASEFRP